MPENRGWSRRFGAAVLVLFLAVGSGVVSAQDRRAEPGSAPLPGRGSIVVEGYVRVVDGSSIEVLLDGRRAAVGVVGIETPQANTRCGEEAATRLRDLIRDAIQCRHHPVDDPMCRCADEPSDGHGAAARRIDEGSTKDHRGITRGST